MPTADTLQIDALHFYQWDSLTVAPVEHTANIGLPMDSIFRPFAESEQVYRQSLFTGHELPMQNNIRQERAQEVAPVWNFIVVLLLCGLLVLYFKMRKITIQEVIKSAVDQRAMDRMIRSNNLNRNYLLLPMGALMIAAVGMGIWQSAMTHTGIGGYLLLSAALSVAYILRNSLLRLFGNVFDNPQAISYYIISNYIYHLILAVITTVLLFPLIYFPNGSEFFSYLFFSLVGLCFLIRLLRGIKIFLTQSKSFNFHLFYYLCIVEIIPYIVLLKWIISQ